jgi:thiol:disulfide interchange protein DsbD
MSGLPGTFLVGLLLRFTPYRFEARAGPRSYRQPHPRTRLGVVPDGSGGGRAGGYRRWQSGHSRRRRPHIQRFWVLFPVISGLEHVRPYTSSLAVAALRRHLRHVKRALGCLLLVVAGYIGLLRPAMAEDPKLVVVAAVEPSRLGTGDRGLLRVDVQIPAGWHLWSMDPGPGPQQLLIGMQPGSGLELADRWYGPEPHAAYDRGFARDLTRYEGPAARFERPVVAVAQNPSSLLVQAQICIENRCLPQKLVVPVQFEPVAAALGQPVPAPSHGVLSVAEPLRPAQLAATSVTSVAPPSLEAELAAAKQRGLLSFVALSFLFGLGALATPCVFPAIPLTVSFFSKYSGESMGRGARLALVYALTMVVAFTVLGVLLSVIFGVTGVQRFAAHPVFNLVLAGVLVFFALNLLGLFEIQAPEFLVGAANRLESNLGDAAQGAGNRRRGGGADYVAVAVAALTSTTVFFTCTVAFVGLVLVAAASGEWFWPSVGMLAFSSAFALPFFLLAMFPQAAKRLQGKAGGWLTATRVTLGFLELAAATKFLSNADLVWAWGLVTRQAVLALWVPLFFLCGLFLLGKLRLGEESTAGPEGQTGVLQMLSAVLMFSLALHLGVGLFQNKPFGGWLDGWLPPVQAAAMAEGSSAPALHWTLSLTEGRARAQREGKLVFVNYTGYTCTNCRYMEGGVFPDPRIQPLLAQMVLVELYTDGGTPEHDANRDDQVKRFNTAALPLYSVEDAQGNVLASFPSSTNDVEEFRRFLAAALASAPPAAAAGASKSASAVRLDTTRLTDGVRAPAVVDGQWSLVNFWATWCSPCREELEGFLVSTGAQLTSRGGAFRAVAVETEEKVPEAQRYMAQLGVPAEAALRIAADAGDRVDPKLEWDESLPFTFLVSPTGEIVWRHTGALKRDQLHAALTRFAGLSLVD